MEIDVILNELEQNRGYFPREAIEEAIRRKGEMIPHLLRSLEDVCVGHVDPSEDEGYFLHIYAMYLLAQFHEKRAYPFITQLCTFPREKLEAMLGDVITEDLPQIIASVFNNDTQPIKSLIENRYADEYARGSAIRSLSILVYEGMLERIEVIAYFTELFRGKLEEDYSHVWDSLASEAVNLYAKDLSGDIHNAFERELICPEYIHPDKINQKFALGEEIVLAHSNGRRGGLIDDAVKEMSWWSCFTPVKAAKPQPLESLNRK